MELTLGRSGANGTDREQIGKELRRDGIQHFTGNRHALGSKIDEELAGNSQALVNLEAAVDIGVIDQTLPADSCAWLLKVRSHNNEKLIFVLLLFLQEKIAVGEGGRGVVDGTRADNDEQSLLLVGAVDNSNGLIAALDDCLLGLG